MPRTLASETPGKIGKSVILKGWVNTRRDHGKIVFIDLRDRTGLVQIVLSPELAGTLHSEDAVYITGLVKARPEKLINPKLASGSVEIEATAVEMVAKSAELPFDMGSRELEVQLPTLLDYRTLTLRHPSVKPIFEVQEAVMKGFRLAAEKLECVEVFVPTISVSATEGGAEVFPVDYYGHKAFMTQSPQLYKQMMVPVFERVFLAAHAYRAEPSVTTRHLSESTQLDCEFGFMEFPELLDALETVGRETLSYVTEKCSKVLKEFGVPELRIRNPIPRLKMREAQEIIKQRTGIDHTQEKDLMPEDEREICRWALEEKNSDLVTVTHYPTKKRAFYTLPDPANPEFSLSFDLLFRGVEILSGSQRINDYDQLVEAIKSRGMNPENFEMYLQAFKFSMPPEGGFSFGLERLTMQILQLENIRQASLFPRDMERVDFRFSTQQNISVKGMIVDIDEQVFQKIKATLDQSDVKYQILDHQAVHTSEEAANIRGTKLEQGAKALIMFGDEKPFLMVLSAAKKADLEAIKTQLKVDKVRMANPAEVKVLTNLEIGSIPPFGSVLKLKTYLDESLGENAKIAFNAGLHTRSIIMDYKDFVKVENPVLGHFLQDDS